MYYRRIEDERIDSDKTQKDIAEYLGCQREVYRRYEKGIRQIPVDYVVKLALRYETSTDYLLELTDDRTPSKKTPKK